jgi:DNA invertase Pin-like site-specific DNA recombinase
MNIALRNGDHVIFAYHDRAFRNTEDCLATLRVWKERGITVHFANLHVDMNDPKGAFMITVMAGCAQMDSAMKSERIKEVFSGFEAMGRLGNGHAPMGFKLVGKPMLGSWPVCVW